MNNTFIKAVLAAVFMFFGCGAYAQCGGLDLKHIGPSGNNFACSQQQANAGVSNTFVFRAVAPVAVVPAPVVMESIPAGYVYRPCTKAEKAEQVLIAGAVGMGAGAMIGDSSRAAGIAGGFAILNAATGECRVAVPAEAGTTRGEKKVPGKCTPEGGATIEVASENECLQKALGGRKSYGKVPTVVGGNTCAVLTRNGEILADFLDAAKNPSGVVVATGAECSKHKAEFEATLAKN